MTLRKIEKIMNKTLTHLNINNLNDEKWSANLDKKIKTTNFCS